MAEWRAETKRVRQWCSEAVRGSEVPPGPLSERVSLLCEPRGNMRPHRTKTSIVYPAVQLYKSESR